MLRARFPPDEGRCSPRPSEFLKLFELEVLATASPHTILSLNERGIPCGRRNSKH